jgi:hypothetical protein
LEEEEVVTLLFEDDEDDDDDDEDDDDDDVVEEVLLSLFRKIERCGSNFGATTYLHTPAQTNKPAAV